MPWPPPPPPPETGLGYSLGIGLLKAPWAMLTAAKVENPVLDQCE